MSLRPTTSGTLVLDTSAYSHLRANHDDVLDRVAAAEVVFVPTVVLGELEAGFRLGRRTQENRVMLQEFLTEPFVSVLEVTVEVARRYGQIFAQLRQAGTPIPVNDIWIAATTIEAASHLLTFDSDFERIAHLERTILTVS
ncbi:MAG TPA: type II toxin-antitoxin system VapC family toxin [Polyangiaceae bacterium]|nr:type II toxin-antitoxin system VapC family toxin [Polyangiaceae bacterium]